MTVVVSTERIFRLPCFEGLRLFRRYKIVYPDLPPDELLSLIDSVEADARSLDMEAAVYLSTLVEADCPLVGPGFYQSCIKAVLLRHQPIWSKAMRRGRERFLNALDPNDRDLFAAAGLMEYPTPLHVANWWDSISGLARTAFDYGKMELARKAEMLTLQRERSKLKADGICKEPEWPGLDDNFAGYDVLSYEQKPTGIVNRLIEVKSTTKSPMRFFITRNEWNKAKRTGEAYSFHVWDMDSWPPALHIRTVADIAPHVPTDNGKGNWSNAEIPVVTSSEVKLSSISS